jgi:hypothetical protein
VQNLPGTVRSPDTFLFTCDHAPVANCGIMRQQDPDHHEIYVLEILLHVRRLISFELTAVTRTCKYSEAVSSEVLQESVHTIRHTMPPATKNTYPDWQTPIILAIAELSSAHPESIRRLHPAATGTAKLSLNSDPTAMATSRAQATRFGHSRIKASHKSTLKHRKGFLYFFNLIRNGFLRLYRIRFSFLLR